MSQQEFLLAISIGPVQDFISAARRTRDLWFGSFMLSELSRCAATRLQAKLGKLIFPTATDAGSSATTISNKIVARIFAEPSQIHALIDDDIKPALRARVQKFGLECRQEIEGALGSAGTGSLATWLSIDTFDGQLLDAFEVYGAWAAVTNAPLGYHAAYHAAERGLAARKLTRSFSQPEINPMGAGAGVYKSSLDGLRESVLLPAWRDKFGGSAALARRMCRQFGIDRNEGLDAVGLIKRVLGRQQNYPAVSRVALAPWVKKLEAEVPCRLEQLEAAYERLPSVGLATRSHGYERLPFDGQLLLNRRRIGLERKSLEDDQAAGDVHAGNAILALDGLETAFVSNGLPALPTPYVAMLKADGDEMGKLLWDAQGAAEHDRISTALSLFVAKARLTLRLFDGVCIYAGADDTLALLPMRQAVACARALRTDFASAFEQTGLPAGPSISIGLAFAHTLEPMATLRDLASRAEHIAKQGLDYEDLKRNALGIVIQPRGGGAIELRGRWDQETSGLTEIGFDTRLQFWVDAFSRDVGGLPMSSASLLREAQLVAGGNARLLEAALTRLFSRRNAPTEVMAVLQRWLVDDPSDDELRRRVSLLEREWLAARWLARQKGKVA